MNRETKRLIEFGKDKAVVRAAIRREFAGKTVPKHSEALTPEVWLRSQPASTRKGIARGNAVYPPYVTLV